ncbi:NPCBM/NEW2 domain-containing protein [Lacunimicrobium album]
MLVRGLRFWKLLTLVVCLAGLGVGSNAANAETFTLTTIDGETVVGDLVSLDRQSAVMTVDGEQRTFPRTDVVQIEQKADQSQVMAITGQMEVRLAGGSVLKVKSIQRAAASSKLVIGDQNVMEVPSAALSEVLVNGLRGNEQERWDEIRKAAQTTDLLIVKKNENLDFVAGVIGNIDAAGVEFLLGERSAKVPWERIYGLMFLKNKPAGPPAGITLETADGQELKVENLTVQNGQLNAQFARDAEVSIAIGKVKRVDFSAGKIRSLSDLKPVAVNVKPFFNREWQPAFDRNTHGSPLFIGGKTYRKGLCLHSYTEITFRLAGEFNQFRCLAGLDQSINPKRGDVNLIIKGDGKTLYEGNFSATSTQSQYVTPLPIELNLAGVNDLTFIVDFGADQIDIGDNLNLVDARLIR